MPYEPLIFIAALPVKSSLFLLGGILVYPLVTVILPQFVPLAGAISELSGVLDGAICYCIGVF